jgi:hypothetical protein
MRRDVLEIRAFHTVVPGCIAVAFLGFGNRNSGGPNPVNDNSARHSGPTVMPTRPRARWQFARDRDAWEIPNEILIPIGLPITECESAYTVPS